MIAHHPGYDILLIMKPNLSTILTVLLLTLNVSTSYSGTKYLCAPTPPDADGPFYRANAPVRNSIGKGYLLLGEVKSAADCAPIAGAQIEIWMTGADGRYDDRWRATLFSRKDGRYYFSSHFPAPYGSRPPHIHLVVNAPGFAELITQHYPLAGSAEAIFDLILIPKP
jgi:protocatechuate 3,4-dioxygenase beta subunit